MDTGPCVWKLSHERLKANDTMDHQYDLDMRKLSYLIDESSLRRDLEVRY
jgi:hypothetical protein